LIRHNDAKQHHSYLRDWVYGGIDGSITTFAIVAGVFGAELSVKVIIILGLANVVADGFSMAAGNYLSTKSEQDEFCYNEMNEMAAIQANPGTQAEKVRMIYQQKGFESDHLDHAVDTITKDKFQWAKTLLQEYYGLPLAFRSPVRAAASTFSAFIICGLVPLFPFFINVIHPFYFSIFATACVFFIIGSLKSRWSITAWWRSGLYTLILGSGAAIIAYCLGKLIASFV